MESVVNRMERNRIFSRLFWDYSMNAEEIERIITAPVLSEEKQKIYLRLLYSANWYTLKNILTEKELKEALDEDIIKKIHIPGLKAKYLHARRFLH